MSRRWSRAGVLLLVCLVAVGCGGGADDGGGTGDDGATPPPSASPGGGADVGDLADPVETARGQLAAELGVDAAEIEVLTAERVTWRNGALGCEQEGRAYTQALVDGYRIELGHDGERYAFHGQDGHPPFHCEEPTESGSATS